MTAAILSLAEARRARAPAPAAPRILVGDRVRLPDGRTGPVVDIEAGVAAVWIRPRHVRVPVAGLVPASRPPHPA